MSVHSTMRSSSDSESRSTIPRPRVSHRFVEVRSAFWALALTCALGGATIPRECTAAIPLFGPRMDFPTGVGPFGLATGYFDSDAIPDLVTANYGPFQDGRTASILLGNGDGTFRKGPVLDTEPGILFFSVADMNEDGIADLIGLNQNSLGAPPLSIFLGVGDGNFQPRVNYGVGFEFKRTKVFAVADMTGDGHLDVVMSTVITNLAGDIPCTTTLGSTTVTSDNGFFGISPGNWVTSRGAPDPARVGIAPGTYVVSVESPSSLTISQPATASGSNTLRYVILGSTVSIWEGRGDGKIYPPTASYDVDLGGDGIAIGDVNKDGLLDIVSTNLSAAAFTGIEGAVKVMTQKADGGFNTPSSYGTRRIAGNAKVADISGDGNPDIVTTNPNYLSVLLGNGDGTFATHVELPTGAESIRSTGVEIVDINEDGRPDLASEAFNNGVDGNVLVFLGTGGGSFGARMDFNTLRFPKDIVARDLNGDGHVDLAVTNYQSNIVSVFLNGGCDPLRGSITGLVPNRGGDAGERTVTIYGCGFEPGATARLTRGGESIDGNPVTVSTDGVVEAVFNLARRSRGLWDVEVSNLGQNPAVRVGGFTIEEAVAPTLFPLVQGRVRNRVGLAYSDNISLFDDGNDDFWKNWAFACIDNNSCVGGGTLHYIYGGNDCVITSFPSPNGGLFTLPWSVKNTSGLTDVYRIVGKVVKNAECCFPTCLTGTAASMDATIFQAQGNGSVSPGAVIASQEPCKREGLIFRFWKKVSSKQIASTTTISKTTVTAAPANTISADRTMGSPIVTSLPATTVPSDIQADLTTVMAQTGNTFAGVAVDMCASGGTLALGTTVTSVSPDMHTLTLSAAASAAGQYPLTFRPVFANVVVGMDVQGGGFPDCTTVTALGCGSLTLDNKALSSGTGTLVLRQKLFADIVPGMLVSGAGIPCDNANGGTRVVSVKCGRELELSAAATADGTSALTYTTWPSSYVVPGFPKALEDQIDLELKTLVDAFTAAPCANKELAFADELILRAVDQALRNLPSAYAADVGTYQSVFCTIYGPAAVHRDEFRTLLKQVSKELVETERGNMPPATPNWASETDQAPRICSQSCDPNAKVGPAGVGNAGYIVGSRPLTYTVYFENLPTAPLAAAEVVVTDHVDPTKVDLSTFSLGPISFGSHAVTPPRDLNRFQTEVDLRPGLNLKVRIIAQLNESTGLLTFRFQSLDPVTGLVPADQTLGFLPPNINSPEGEGSVSFSVRPRTDLFTGAEIRNSSVIVFDTNDPIPTNEWLNTIDVTKPSSHVDALSPVPDQETRILAQWSGTDGLGSGIGNYAIYVSDNGAPYTLWRSTAATQDTFPGQDGHTYGFYSIARDLVGFEEDPPSPLVPDASITVVACSVAMGFDFTPGTLNLRSMGHWVIGYLEPPSPFTPAEIDTASIRLNGTVKVDPTAPTEIGDHDADGIPDLMVKFNRAAVELTVSQGDSVPVTVKGTVGGQCFSGKDYIRVLRAVVSAPAAGSALPPGITTTVRWTTPAGVQIQSVTLLSSVDDGATWNLDAQGLPNTGSAQWVAPSVTTDRAKVAVVLVESADATGYIVDGVLGTSGTFIVANAAGVDGGGKVEFALRVVRPNPTQQDLSVSFGLPESRPATIEVFNVSGRLVASREVGSLGVGFHTVTLGGRGTLASGVYIVRLTQGGKRLTTRAVLVR